LDWYGKADVPNGLSDVIGIAAGGFHCAALRADGSVVCWGLNDQGQTSTPDGLLTRQLTLGYAHSVSISCGVDIDLRNSNELGAVGFGVAKSHRFASLPPAASGPVTLEIIARGDLDLASEFLIVTLDDQTPGTILFSSLGAASDCPTEPDRAIITIDEGTYAALAADGALTVSVASSVGVSASQCETGSLELELAIPKFPQDCNSNGVEDRCDLRTQGGFFDCDRNGVIDSCEIAANARLDCNANGLLDWCEIAAGAQDKDADGRLDDCEYRDGDFDLDGTISGADLAGILALWGVQAPPYGDLDGDGVVGGGDLAVLLNRWGPLEP
jgi:hypothetical protein